VHTRQVGLVVAFGACLLVAVGAASSNLFAATPVSILYVGAMMIAGGVLASFWAFAVNAVSLIDESLNANRIACAFDGPF
jgi:uncharacterized membrane protein HdeD (DUF308 family)